MIHACMSTIQKQKLVIQTREEKINITKHLKYSFCNQTQVWNKSKKTIKYPSVNFILDQEQSVPISFLV